MRFRDRSALAAALSEAGFTDVVPYELPRLRRLPVTLEGAAGRNPRS